MTTSNGAKLSVLVSTEVIHHSLGNAYLPRTASNCGGECIHGPKTGGGYGDKAMVVRGAPILVSW